MTGGVSLSSHALNDANLKAFDNSTTSRSSRPSGSVTSKTLSGANSGIVSEAASMAGLNPWKGMSKRHGGSTANSTSGAQFTGYDPAGGSHKKVRAFSTVVSDDSEKTTTADPSFDYKAEVSTLDRLCTNGELRTESRKQHAPNSQRCLVKVDQYLNP